MNENGWNAFDQYAIIEGFKIDKITHHVEGIYKDGQFIPEANMSTEDRHRGYNVMLKHTFDLRLK